MLKLNVGCGDVYLNGWVNIDLDSSKADLKCDVRGRLPYEDASVDFIFSEHFIEHLSVNDGVEFFKECFRVLKPGGVVRTGTIDLNYILFRHFFFWRKQDWIKKYGYGFVKTDAELTNICFREWGHYYLYNKRELKRRLSEAGFSKIISSKFVKSFYKDLAELETRKETRLILEAIKL